MYTWVHLPLMPQTFFFCFLLFSCLGQTPYPSPFFKLTFHFLVRYKEWLGQLFFFFLISCGSLAQSFFFSLFLSFTQLVCGSPFFLWFGIFFCPLVHVVACDPSDVNKTFSVFCLSPWFQVSPNLPSCRGTLLVWHIFFPHLPPMVYSAQSV